MSAKSIGRILIFAFFAVLFACLIIYFVRPGYPIRRVIKNTEGKAIDALISGKLEGTLYFKRMPDRTSFALPLDKLAFRDRVLLTILREQAPPVSKPTPDPQFTDNYISNRFKKIAELQKKLEIMLLEYNSGTLNPLIENDYKRRIDKIKYDIRTLEVAIETHRYRLKKD